MSKKYYRVYFDWSCTPETNTFTRTVAVPKTQVVKQEPHQQKTRKDTERTDLKSISPQPPLPNQQDERDKR